MMDRIQRASSRGRVLGLLAEAWAVHDCEEQPLTLGELLRRMNADGVSTTNEEIIAHLVADEAERRKG